MIPNFFLLLLTNFSQIYLQGTVLRIEPTETSGEECWWLDLMRSSGLSFVGILGLKQFDILVTKCNKVGQKHSWNIFLVVSVLNKNGLNSKIPFS